MNVMYSLCFSDGLCIMNKTKGSVFLVVGNCNLFLLVFVLDLLIGAAQQRGGGGKEALTFVIPQCSGIFKSLAS